MREDDKDNLVLLPSILETDDDDCVIETLHEVKLLEPDAVVVLYVKDGLFNYAHSVMETPYVNMLLDVTKQDLLDNIQQAEDDYEVDG